MNSGHFDFEKRKALAESAEKIGIRPTARLFATRIGTVKKWLRIYGEGGADRLIAHIRTRRPFSSVTKEQLAECRKDLAKAKTIRGDDWIACLECGRLLQRIDGTHLRRDGLTLALYKEKWGYNRGSGLCSNALASRWAARAKNPRNIERLRKIGPRFHPGQSGLSGKKMRREGIANIRVPEGPRRDKQKGVTDWQIAKARLRGDKLSSIAKAAGLSETAVRWRLKRMRFPCGRGPFAFQHGHVLTAEVIADAAVSSGLSVAQLTRKLGLAKSTLHHHLRQPAKPIPRSLALTITRARALLPAKAASTAGGRPPAISFSERRSLKGTYRELLADLKQLRGWLRDERRDKVQVGDWIWREARLGKIRRLLFWPEFFGWGYATFTTRGFLSATWTPYEVAIDFLAFDFQVSSYTIETSLGLK